MLLILFALAAASCKNRSNRISDTLSCTAGEPLVIGCTGSVGSACSGNPTMDACDGSVLPNACTDANALAFDDDYGGTLCPELTTTCPVGGRITVAVRGSSAGGAAADFGCYWDIAHGTAPLDAATGGGG